MKVYFYRERQTFNSFKINTLLFEKNSEFVESRFIVQCHELVTYTLRVLKQIMYILSSSSHIRRVEISGEPRSFRQTFDVYLLFS